MLKKRERYVYVPPRAGVPAWPGGSVCRPAYVGGNCIVVMREIFLPKPEGNIPPYGIIYMPEWFCVDSGPPGITCQYVAPYPEVPAQPWRYDPIGNNRWNAGANSVTALTVDCEVAFDMPKVVGVSIGFVFDRADQTNPDRVVYGMRFGISAAGAAVFHVSEVGQRRTGDAEYSPSDIFKIRRVGGTVSYLVNDAIIYVSARECVETELIVGSALFAFGDTIP